MRFLTWLKPATPVVPESTPSISPDSVVSSQQTDAAVLDLVHAQTLHMDERLVAQIRARIKELDAQHVSAQTR